MNKLSSETNSLVYCPVLHQQNDLKMKKLVSAGPIRKQICAEVALFVDIFLKPASDSHDWMTGSRT